LNNTDLQPVTIWLLDSKHGKKQKPTCPKMDRFVAEATEALYIGPGPTACVNNNSTRVDLSSWQKM